MTKDKEIEHLQKQCKLNARLYLEEQEKNRQLRARVAELEKALEELVAAHGDIAFRAGTGWSISQGQWMAADEKLVTARTLLAASQQEQDIASSCGYQGKHFGAIYEDGGCIDGYLWDLDSCDDTGSNFSSGGDIPCPQCNSEKYAAYCADEQQEREDGRT